MDKTAIGPMPSTKPLVVVAIMAAVGALIFGAVIYFGGSHSLSVQAKEQGRLIYLQGTEAGRAEAAQDTKRTESIHNQKLSSLFEYVDDWAKSVTLATAASGAGIMLSLAFGAVWWRQSWIRRVSQHHQQFHDKSQQIEQDLNDAQKELRQESAKRLDAETKLARLEATWEVTLRQRTEDLSNAHAKLEQELNERRKTEKSLTYQRQELARSKDVLELHVQARTQELQKLQRRYEHILNSAGEGIYGLDLQGRTTFVNPAAAKLTGWSVEELAGKPEREVFHRQATDSAPTGNREIMDRNGNLLAEQVFFRKDGASFAVEYIRTPILENGRMMGAVVLFKDITERKRSEETLARKAAELARSNAELEQFAYVASHDLQEPLRKIQAFGGRLKAKLSSVKLSEGADYLERMQNAAARMQILINDLLTFSRVISSNQPFVQVDLGLIAREVLGDLEVVIERTKAQVEVKSLASIDADPMQMRQLLQNLISNSLKFQPADRQPQVTISTQVVKKPFSCTKNPTPDDEVCELEVLDNGIGIEEQYLEKIFAVFQRLHGRSDYEGTGVGLAVCRRIADRHGGTIRASSQEGEGTRFTVTLPVRQSNEETYIHE